MASDPASHELEIVLQRFFRLLPADQLRAHRAIRDYLSHGIRETKKERIVAAKTEALEAFEQVARHLSLPSGVAPTPEQFDEAACALGLRWNRSRVRRAWGRWRFAKAAFLGEPLPESAKQRDERRKIGRRHDREGHLESVKLWLSTKPPAVTAPSYNNWARQYNENLPPDALPVPYWAVSISQALGIIWSDVVRLARGEITEQETRPTTKRPPRIEFSNGPHQLVSYKAMKRILDQSGRNLIVETARPGFPAPVIVLSRVRIWLRGDIEEYKNGRRWTPEENERQRNSLRDTYMTRDDITAATGLNRGDIDIRRRGLPEPVALVGARSLWLRAEVEASPAAAGLDQQRGPTPG